jgi:hypothetical protein
MARRETSPGERFVKLRYAVLLFAGIALVATGCGSDSGESKAEDNKKMSKREKAQAEDRDNKEKARRTPRTSARAATTR